MFHDLTELHEDQRILDLGASSGSFASDVTRAMVVRVDLACRNATSGGRFVQASAASLPFPGESFDVVIANHSFEHFDDLVPSILEMGRSSKKTALHW